MAYTIVQSRANAVATSIAPGMHTIYASISFAVPTTPGNAIVVVASIKANQSNNTGIGVPATLSEQIADDQLNAYSTDEWVQGGVQLRGIGQFTAANPTGGVSLVEFSIDVLNLNPIFSLEQIASLVAFEVTDLGAAPVVTDSATQQNTAVPLPMNIAITDSDAVVLTSGFGSTVVQNSGMVVDQTAVTGDLITAAFSASIVSVIPTVSPAIFSYVLINTASLLGTDYLNVWWAQINPALGITCDSPPDGIVGVAYTHTFPATDGTPPYTFSITAGALPDGLTLDSATGEVSGTPTVADTFPFTIQVEDADLATATVDCSITIVPAITISCDDPPEGAKGVAYTHTFPVAGGTLPFVFSIISGALPTGLVLDPATGVVSGIPIAGGIFTFTIRVDDAVGGQSSVACSINILQANCANPPDGEVTRTYTHTFTETGGVGPYTFAITAGTLPPGLTLDPATGVLSGVPIADGTFTFDLTVTDSASPPVSATVTCSITIGVNPGNIIIHYWEEVPEGIEPRLLMGTPGGLLVTVDESGSDNGADLRAIIRTPSFDMGDPRALKLFMDTMTDNDATGGIGVTAGFNNYSATFGIGSMGQNTREQTLLSVSNLNPNGLVLYRNIALEYVFGTGSVLYEAEPSYFIQPFTSKLYTTQLLASGIPGWKQVRYLRFTMISVADVQFQILNDDGVLVADIAVPNTQGILRNGFIQMPNACKGRMLRYSASSDSEFVLFVEDTSVRIKKWGGPQFVEVRPFLQ